MPEENANKNIALMLTAFFGIIATSLFMMAIISLHEQTKSKTQTTGALQTDISERDPFTDIHTEAEAAVVFDTVTGKILYEKNGTAQLPLASVTKVMTALVAADVPQETRVSVETKDLQDGMGGLRLGEKWNLKDLINYTLVVSSNSGANTIASAVGAAAGRRSLATSATFLQLMNAKTKELGMNQTFYLNPSGLDINVQSGLSGAYGSAEDMAKLFSYIIKNKPSLLEMTAYDSLQFASADGALHAAINTNTVARSIPGLIASKTGLTDLANGNLVIAFDVGPAHPVVVAVLGSSADGRFKDVERLVGAAIIAVGQE